ncbi:class II glutamine amidotransferase domain-containing protein [Nguyenibacter vanlangensis]|uniref:Glutamine amidotransferase n=1 Tax=Nguyenibacter vanlangensis TaxID=1216886 RepID=A0A7Y7M5J9_9PROT|nr:glutamine amidotransferase [Nguyenibacter vanlangensis]NVN09686.1 glutamine amidotransferase [Nguyenibacter vanlangensis]
MCGIVGLFLKKPELRPELGTLTARMLDVMTERGPDSAGFAIYNAEPPGKRKLTLRIEADDADLVMRLDEALAVKVGDVVDIVRRDDHVVIRYPAEATGAVGNVMSALALGAVVVADGEAMELYKGVGLPRDVTTRFGLAGMAGTHAIGHTRMATESAVTIAGAHPFSTGPDQCLVHNGSLSNHNALRRKLRSEGIRFSTENDSEVAAGYLSWRMSQGARLDEALDAALGDLDGFYTFVVGTRTGFAVLRDPIACKPAVMVETDDYVAFGSEYRALVDLPGVEHGRVFEPAPQTVYYWEHAA